MKQATWHDSGFTITSYGNGLSYLVKNEDGREFFLQGDDAIAWREEYDLCADDEGKTFLHESMNNYECQQ